MALLEHAPKRHTMFSSLYFFSRTRLIGCALSLLVIAWVGVSIYKCPFTRKQVLQALERESGGAVQIGVLKRTWWPPGYVAEDIRIYKDATQGRPPVLTVQELRVVARPLDVLLMRKRLKLTVITGLRATIRRSETLTRKPEPPRFSEVTTVRFDNAILQFPTVDSDPKPLTIAIKSVLLKDVSENRAGTFAAELYSNEPLGAAHVFGHMGPWNWKELGKTPIEGTFAFPKADLGIFGGIQGFLNASGEFNGPLGQVRCTGSATVPDLRVSKSTHSVALSTSFQAVVDGLTGDTTLEHAESHFNRTVIDSRGWIRKDPTRPGKLAVLDLSIEEGQVGDVLLLLTRASQASMEGTVDLRMHVEIPPGPPSFLKKLVLAAEFGIDRGHFTKAKAQVPLNHLSESAAGMGKQARNESHRTVLSDVTGHFSARHGIATLSEIKFQMPGALGTLSGSFDLLDQAIGLKGRLMTTGELSSTASGFKAVMLKMIAPFFTKDSVTTVPFRITGTAQHPKFKLDLLHRNHF